LEMLLTVSVGRGPILSRPQIVAGVIIVVVLIAGEFVFEERLGLPVAGRGSRAVKVDRVYLDAVDAPSGMVYFLAEVNASNSDSVVWHFDPSLFTATSNTSATYPSVSAYNMTVLLGKAELAQGQRLVGFVAFEMPLGQGVTKLAYDDVAGGVSLRAVEVPAVSGVATRFDPSVHFMLNGTSWASTIETWAAITNQTSGLAFFGGEKMYKNNTFVFFTGQKIGVTFFFDYFKRPSDPTTIYVRSITNKDGFAVSDVLASQTTFGFASYGQPHPLPVNMTGYGANAIVTLVVTVPQGRVTGVLHFTVQFSS